MEVILIIFDAGNCSFIIDRRLGSSLQNLLTLFAVPFPGYNLIYHVKHVAFQVGMDTLLSGN